MIKLTIDNIQIEVTDGSTILDAAEKAQIDIPTMCYLKPYLPNTSCMICVVKLIDSGKLVPACAWPAQDGITIDTKSDEVISARKTAIELLLSEHLGDCVGPCQTACPAGMDIPLMIKQIALGQFQQAIETIKKDIALPAVLGRICPAPCEKVCRRDQIDQPLAICLLKRFAADTDLASPNPYTPKCGDPTGKSVAIIGAGPAGLAAAYYLTQKGHACTVFDQNDQPGGMLRSDIDKKILPEPILNAEIKTITDLGVNFQGNTRVGIDITMEQLKDDYDAVFIAAGTAKADSEKLFNLPVGVKGIEVKHGTYQTASDRVFAGGDIIRSRKLAIRSLADGKEAAASIDQLLSAKPITGRSKIFNSRLGKLKCSEKDAAIFGASADKRHSASGSSGLDSNKARKEADRCLHCECLKADNCKLRDIALEHGAKSKRYDSIRKIFHRNYENDQIIYEPRKCIHCGLCVQISEKNNENPGLSFINRGIDVQVAVPFGDNLNDSLKCAFECAKVCPTGAIASQKNLKRNKE